MDLANYPINFSKISKHPINPYPRQNAEIHAECFLNTGGQEATNFIGVHQFTKPPSDSRAYVKIDPWNPGQHGIRTLTTPKIQKMYQ